MSRVAAGMFEPEGVRPLVELLMDLDRYDDNEWIYVQPVELLKPTTLAVVTGPNREDGSEFFDELGFKRWAQIEDVREAVECIAGGDLTEGSQRLIDLIQDYVG